MTEENVNLVRRVFDAFADRDVEAALAVVDPEIEFLPVTASIASDGEPYRGHDGIRAYFEDAGRVWDELRTTPESFREVGERVLVLGRVYARSGGQVVDSPAGWVWTFRNGRIVRGQVFSSAEAALRSVGVAE